MSVLFIQIRFQNEFQFNLESHLYHIHQLCVPLLVDGGQKNFPKNINKTITKGLTIFNLRKCNFLFIYLV